MSTATQSAKKTGLCRYFVRYGDCFHGEHCQFIHAMPPSASPPSQTTYIEPQTPVAPPNQVNHASQNTDYHNHSYQAPYSPPPPYQPAQPTQGPQNHRFSKLICSFKSDLPNEIDFGIQIATILANSETFVWSTDYPVVDAMCSSLHTFACVCQTESTCYCYSRFWHKLLVTHSKNSYLTTAALPPEIDPAYMNFDTLEDHDLKDHLKIYARIKKAAELIMQFSMTTEVTKVDKKEETIYDYHRVKKKKQKASFPLLKFVSLLLHCDDMTFNTLGLTIISNTASKLSKVTNNSPNDQVCAKLIRMFQDYVVDSVVRLDGDIQIINRSIEAISNLISSSNKRVSSQAVNMIVEKNVVERIEQFLTCQYDVSLFLSALECCYRISRHHPNLLVASGRNYLIKLLVLLLDCEDKSFFKHSALKKIKLVEDDDNVLDLDIGAETYTNLQTTTHSVVPNSARQTASSPAQPKVPFSALPSNPTPAPTPSPTPNQVPNQTVNLVGKSLAPAAPPIPPNATAPPQLNTNTNLTTATTTTATTTTTTSSNTTTATAVTSSSATPTTSITSTTITTSTIAATSTTTAKSTISAASNTTTIPTGTTTKNTSTVPTPGSNSAPAAHLTEQYACDWNGCDKKFGEAKTVYNHVFEVHVGPIESGTLSSCLWSGPNGSGPGCLTKRPKYSLLTHLNDFHCNPIALGQAANRCQLIKPPEHPGYAPNAALHAIKRHANAQLEVSNNHKTKNNVSPLSVSVRLTAALILRNLATESSEMKEALENHEPLLSEICMSNERDEAKIIAECLSLFSTEWHLRIIYFTHIILINIWTQDPLAQVYGAYR